MNTDGALDAAAARLAVTDPIAFAGSGWAGCRPICVHRRSSAAQITCDAAAGTGAGASHGRRDCRPGLCPAHRGPRSRCMGCLYRIGGGPIDRTSRDLALHPTAWHGVLPPILPERGFRRRYAVRRWHRGPLRARPGRRRGRPHPAGCRRPAAAQGGTGPGGVQNPGQIFDAGWSNEAPATGAAGQAADSGSVDEAHGRGGFRTNGTGL